MDLLNYFQGLPAVKLAQLYDSPFTCQAVLRSLPAVAKQYVSRLLFVEAGLPKAVVASWVLPDAASKHTRALELLERLQLLNTLLGQAGEASYLLNRTFQQKIREAACTGLASLKQVIPREVADAAPQRSALEEYARQQWEQLLLFLVGSRSHPPAPAEELHDSTLQLEEMFRAAGLLLKDELTRKYSVSDLGFQFLLMGTYEQLWVVLRQYITGAEGASGSELASVISFLLRLGAHGQECISLAHLSPLERRVAAHMAQLGLAKPFYAGSALWLCPTQLAAIMAGGRAGAARAAADGFIVVESNYRVYAYTTSAVQISILRLFVRCDVLLPNLFVGTITRESTTEALTMGIGAEQIVSYLREHAHPRVASRVPLVPGVVADQIRLWHQELKRLQAQSSMMYSNWESAGLFGSVARYAEQLSAVVFRNDEKQVLVVARGYHDAIRNEIRRQKTM